MSLSLPALSLPPAPLHIREVDDRKEVWCMLRRRYVVLTPEEWVRQHFVHFLTSQRGYPAALMGNEVGLRVGSVMRRCDTVLYNKDGGTPLAVMEYKAPHIPITQEVFTQICSYNSVLHSPYLFVSNGMRTVACRINLESGTYQFLPDIPSYKNLLLQK